jgi:hypothetical protein
VKVGEEQCVGIKPRCANFYSQGESNEGVSCPRLDIGEHIEEIVAHNDAKDGDV